MAEAGALQSCELLPRPCGGGAARGGLCSSLGLWKGLTLLLLAAVLVLVLVLALALAQRGAVTETAAATVMTERCRPCPEDWIWYRNQCYYFSKEMQNWNSSWKFCWSHNATLAMIKEKSALDTIYSNKGEENYWIGLRKEPEGWRWVDGSPFINDTISLEKEGQNMACAYLNMLGLAAIDCMSLRPWICVRKST
ncbi:C-type lectin domain family 2 member L-like isoform X2 [Alligator sinensis]|uniref:C-type lectin domain family 2 member L-like isoform X2 n=1 Tax=Alligator sinensis TaxID=38654 RepID=A0A3Q0H9Z2_ALLSI|nr:C-type lectin domain family 2 member L-like isoform X2 [Alligator sinensis]